MRKILPSLLLLLLLLPVAAMAAAGGATPNDLRRHMAAAKADPLHFYVAKGEANACGPGCDTWIAAEGIFDSNAAARLRAFLSDPARRKLPVYFNSTGGLTMSAVSIGRQLRQMKMTTGVARTVPLGCASKPKGDKACADLKKSSQPVKAEFRPIAAVCGSACVYALAGGSVRLVPRGALIGIHAPAIMVTFIDGRVAVGSASKLRQHNQRIRQYFQEMGIEAGLNEASLSTPHRQVRFLTRAEIIRFNLDPRILPEDEAARMERALMVRVALLPNVKQLAVPAVPAAASVQKASERNVAALSPAAISGAEKKQRQLFLSFETPWRFFDDREKPSVKKSWLVVARIGDKPGAMIDKAEYFRHEMSLSCASGQVLRLTYDRDYSPGDERVIFDILMTSGSEKLTIDHGHSRLFADASGIPVDERIGVAPRAFFDTAANAPWIEISEVPWRVAGYASSGPTSLSTVGLGQALTDLAQQCK